MREDPARFAKDLHNFYVREMQRDAHKRFVAGTLWAFAILGGIAVSFLAIFHEWVKLP